jgi:hypothetical protein
MGLEYYFHTDVYGLDSFIGEEFKFAPLSKRVEEVANELKRYILDQIFPEDEDLYPDYPECYIPDYGVVIYPSIAVKNGDIYLLGVDDYNDYTDVVFEVNPQTGKIERILPNSKEIAEEIQEEAKKLIIEHTNKAFEGIINNLGELVLLRNLPFARELAKLGEDINTLFPLQRILENFGSKRYLNYPPQERFEQAKSQAVQNKDNFIELLNRYFYNINLYEYKGIHILGTDKWFKLEKSIGNKLELTGEEQIKITLDWLSRQMSKFLLDWKGGEPWNLKSEEDRKEFEERLNYAMKNYYPECYLIHKRIVEEFLDVLNNPPIEKMVLPEDADEIIREVEKRIEPIRAEEKEKKVAIPVRYTSDEGDLLRINDIFLKVLRNSPFKDEEEEIIKQTFEDLVGMELEEMSNRLNRYSPNYDFQKIFKDYDIGIENSLEKRERIEPVRKQTKKSKRMKRRR